MGSSTRARQSAPPGESPPGDRIQSLSRGLRILEFVHAAERPVGIKEVAFGVGLQLPTAYHLVNTLLYDGYLERDDARLLRPGRLPGSLDGRVDVAVRRALGRAAYAVDDVAVLACPADAETPAAEARVTATAEVPGAASARHYPANSTGLMHLLAVGRVILAHQQPDVADETIALTRRAASMRGELFDEAELRDSLAEIAERRYGVLVSEGHACVATPIFRPTGELFGAVAVVVEPRRLQRGHDHLVTAASIAAREAKTTLHPNQTTTANKEATCTSTTATGTSPQVEDGDDLPAV